MMLEVSHLQKVFHTRGRDVHALDDVSLSIGAGECLAVVGETGSGKSTLGRVVLGLTVPDSGSVSVAGRDWHGTWGRRRNPHRLDVQPVFQNPQQSLNPRRRIGDSLAQAMHAREGASNTRTVEHMLERVGLRPAAKYIARYPRELSGGELQRVAIARALLTRPTLIVADEPTSALDVSLRAGVLNVLEDLQRTENVAILLVTHDILVARAVSSRTVVMRQGRIVEAGPTPSVLGPGATDPYTIRLLAAVPNVDTVRSSAQHTYQEETERG